MSQAQNGKPSASSPSLPRLQPLRATKPYANTSATPTALAAAKRAKHHAHKAAMPENLAAYTSSQQQAPFLENPKKPFSEITKIAA